MSKQDRTRAHVCNRCRDLFFQPRAESGEFVPVGATSGADKSGRKYDWAYRKMIHDPDPVPRHVCDDVGCRFGTTWGRLAYTRFTKQELFDVIDEAMTQPNGGQR